MKKRTRRQKAIIRRNIFVSFCAVLLAAVIALLSYVVVSIVKDDDSNTAPQKSESDVTEALPKEDPEYFATVLSTGDVMVHSPQLSGAYVSSTKNYDFTDFFKASQPYFEEADLSVANLEVTFGGESAGAYSGYPMFNCPDTLADAITSSGLNFLLTANNHSYDTGFNGLVRTAKVLKEKGIEFIGTRETADDPIFTVKDVNGIKIGMANYTYSTYNSSTGVKALNGMSMKKEANDLVNTFCYNHLDDFYADAKTTIEQMKQNGAEFIVFYMHWGNEYQLKPNTYQKQIAQELSNLGVNIIIGSHPHVIQPIELIHSDDGENTTVCLYSTGNAVSNQRQELMDSCPSGHTEDGMFFYYTLRKKGDEVTLQSVNVIPTWVNKYSGGSGYLYTIYPLENATDGSKKYNLSSNSANRANRSYNRTKALLQEGLTEVQEYLGCEVTFK